MPVTATQGSNNDDLMGEVTFQHAMLIGKQDAGNALVAQPGQEHNFPGLPGNMSKHRVEDVACHPCGTPVFGLSCYLHGI